MPRNGKTALISHASKVMLKKLQVRLQQYLNWNLLDFKNLDLEKSEKQEINLAISTGSQKKQREFQKNIYFCFTDYVKDSVDHN